MPNYVTFGIDWSAIFRALQHVQIDSRNGTVFCRGERDWTMHYANQHHFDVHQHLVQGP